MHFRNGTGLEDGLEKAPLIRAGKETEKLDRGWK
jgi:hypothetical protein